MAETIPFDKEAPIRILDLGAGYGALAQFLLRHFWNATAVCQDGSEEMAQLGHKRLADFEGRFSYCLCDFSQQGWSRALDGAFEAIVSSNAIHNVRSSATIRSIYREVFPLVKRDGCFLNFDRTPSLEHQLEWLEEAKFVNVKCFWRTEKRSLFGGFKK